MAKPIVCWFDFASPYAYIARGPLTELAGRHGRTVEWRPVLLWAVLNAQNITPPGESPAKWSYLVNDMVRSAAYHGVPYRQPPLPLSTHLAARLYYALAGKAPTLAGPLIDAVFHAFMVDGAAIGDPEIILAIAARLGIDRETALEAMNGAEGRAGLAAAVEAAVADGVIGSPFMLLDGEAFFGTDRLPQLAWRLGDRANLRIMTGN